MPGWLTTQFGRNDMIYDGLAISLVLLFLSGVVLMCIVATGMALLMNRSNVGELMPIAMKGAKISAVLAAICILLELISPGSVVRAASIDMTTAVLFLWASGLIYLLKFRSRSYHLGS